ncbi:MAG: hypothetical protein KIT58_00140 [Planctomycetota bacterium]|nr:hypothetical protein [Planctomycetota bacterium]
MSRTAGLASACGVALVALAAQGCGSPSRRATLSHDPGGQPTSQPPAGVLPATHEPGWPAPQVSVTTAEGVNVRYPVWVAAHPAQEAAMFDEIRTVVPEADPRIDPSVRGVPAGTTVVVLDPGAYYAPYSPTLLATGEWRAPSTIYVAWRGGSSGLRLPALAHELRHALTQDPDAGH